MEAVAGVHLVETGIGPTSIRQAGERIYSTMPWPPMVKSLADALRFTEVAYYEAHLRGARELIGRWRVDAETAGRTVLVDETPYPCSLQEGVIAGFCRAFSDEKPSYTMLDPDAAKRAGGTTTRYEVTYEPA